MAHDAYLGFFQFISIEPANVFKGHFLASPFKFCEAGSPQVEKHRGQIGQEGNDVKI